MTERVLSQIVEFDIDRCQNVYGVGACTAGRVESGTAQARSGVQLDGVDDFIVKTGLTFSPDDGAVEFWVKDAAAGVGNYLFRSDANTRTYVQINGNTLTVFKGNPAVSSSTAIVPGNRNHILLTWRLVSGVRTYDAYLNGVAFTTGAVFLDNANGSYVVLGALSTGGTQNAAGKFDELRCYNRWISPTEAAAHVLGLYDNETGLYLYWPLNDGAGTSASDASGNGLDGTLTNGPTWIQDLLVEKGLRLRAAASAVNGAFKGMTLRLADGRERKIVGYHGGSKVARLDKRWPTNYIVNNSMQGAAVGAPGSAPTGWSIPNSTTGLSREILAVGSEDDIDYVDIRFSGITSGALALFFDPVAGATPAAAPGQSWIHSCHFKLLSQTGLTNIELALSEGNPGEIGGRVTTQLLGALSPTVWHRASAAKTFNFSALTSTARAFYIMRAGSGVAVDFTLRIGSPQMDLGGLDLLEMIRTTGAAIGLPDATTNYTVIDRPNACYNFYRGCQDKPNYLKGSMTVPFTGTGAPIPQGQLVRPYVTGAIQTAPTEIDPYEGLSVRAASQVSLIDEPCADVDMDPYVRDRLTPAKGTWWSRFFARNLNYRGRPARVKQGFYDRGVFGVYSTERFIIDSMTGPGAGGEVTVTLKDPLKQMDRSKAPAPTTGKLAQPLLAADLQMVLQAGDGAQYESSGWVRNGKEIIRYTSKVGDVLSWPNSTYREQFGTAIAEGAVSDVIQQCLVYINVPLWQVLQDLQNRAAVDNSLIDLVQLAAEDATWLGNDYRVTACISDPEVISDLVKELLQQTGSVMWWDPIAQLSKFKVYAPQSPAALGGSVIADDHHILDGSVSVSRLEDKRVTLTAIYFDLFVATENSEEANNYRAGEIAVDADAESENEYDERLPRTIYSRWFKVANTQAMRQLVQRDVARNRDAPERIQFSLDPKHGALKTGDVTDIQTARLVDSAGNVRTARLFITRREDKGDRVDYAARLTNFDRPYGFIAPNGTGDYPNHNGYAVISRNDGRMTDGTAGSLII